MVAKRHSISLQLLGSSDPLILQEWIADASPDGCSCPSVPVDSPTIYPKLPHPTDSPPALSPSCPTHINVTLQ